MPSINSNYDKKISFTGLTSYLRKTVFPCDDVKKLATDIFDNSFAGNLPSEWIEKIPKNQRTQTIKDVFQGFREFVQLINEKSETALSQLEKTLKGAGILSYDKSINLKFEGSGSYGRVYRLEGLENQKTGEQYVIKLYNKAQKNAQNNGIFAELNRGGLYWPEALGKKTQMVKTFFADLESGFVVNKFIDDSLASPKNIVPSKLLGLESYDDHPKQNVLNNLYSLNVINGYVIDQGCLRAVCPEIINSKDARYVIKKIFFTPKNKAYEKWLELLNNPAYKHNSSVKVALIEAMEYLQPGDRTKCFNEILERFNKDQKLKHYLTKNIKFIQDEDFAPCFAKLWSQSEPVEKNELIKNIDRLPQKMQKNYISEAIKEKTLIPEVVEKFDNLPKEELADLFNSAIKESDDESKIKLFEKLFLLPEELRLEYAKKILQNIENMNILGKVEEKTYLLRLNGSQDYKKAYEFLITDAKDTTKVFIISKVLKNLDFEDYVKAVKLLAKDSSEAVKFKLAPTLEKIIENKSAKREDLDFIYQELAKNTNNQNYLDYIKEVFQH
ncbi:MAG TPA: hypothetical protein PKI94_07010 [Candidatus Gastranaerophilaceae bacterium]|nr:hypothetical protein [Candidatus Gastranaerophilaceae bacterium]